MKRRNRCICFVAMGLIWCVVLGASVKPTAKTLYMKDTDEAKIILIPGRSTVLSFPDRPTKVILGNTNLFSIEYIERDIAIAPLVHTARSNLFVYLSGRRFAFDLCTGNSGGDEIILIRDGKAKEVIEKAWKKKPK